MPPAKKKQKEPIEKAVSGSASNKGSVKLDTFETFGKLPVELRLRIWKIASFFQRNMVLKPDNVVGVNLDFDPWRDANLRRLPLCCTSPCPPPAVLHICKESREEGLKHYSLEFGAHEDIELKHNGHSRTMTLSIPPIVYINWKADRVVVPRSSWMWLDDEPELGELFASKGLTSLALNISDGKEALFAISMVSPGSSLQELILFAHAQESAETLKACEFRDIKFAIDRAEWQMVLQCFEGNHDDEDAELWVDILDGYPEFARDWFETPAQQYQVRICELQNPQYRSKA